MTSGCKQKNKKNPPPKGDGFLLHIDRLENVFKIQITFTLQSIISSILRAISYTTYTSRELPYERHLQLGRVLFYMVIIF